MKKNASLDEVHYLALAAKLEYFDLKDLQDAITSKSGWQKFEGRFLNKESLNTKFDQLAELRNSIRHSCAVGEIAPKEGEAAIIWFKNVLGS